MTGYIVDWVRDAERDLAEIWLRAQDRQSVTRAQATVDDQLARDPINTSMELAEGLRKLVAPPLQVLFSVDGARRRVEVARVTRI